MRYAAGAKSQIGHGAVPIGELVLGQPGPTMSWRLARLSTSVAALCSRPVHPVFRGRPRCMPILVTAWSPRVPTQDGLARVGSRRFRSPDR